MVAAAAAVLVVVVVVAITVAFTWLKLRANAIASATASRQARRDKYRVLAHCSRCSHHVAQQPGGLLVRKLDKWGLETGRRAPKLS